MRTADEAKAGDYFVLREAPSIEAPDAAERGYSEIEDWSCAQVDAFAGWSSGVPAPSQPSPPVEIRVVRHGGYVGTPDEYYDNSIPLVSQRLREALDAAGVDNIRYLPVTLCDSESAVTHPYFAFNLIGLVDAVDLRKSALHSHDGDFVGDSAISDLAVDGSAARGLSMFRLRQKFSVVLVHRRVKAAIERVGIPTVKFIAPEDLVAL